MYHYLGGIFLGWSLGANDSANTFGTAVSSRMVSYRTAVILIAVFVIVGAWAQGSHGIETLGMLTKQDARTALICTLSAALAVTLMTAFKLPVSTSQAAVGAIAGIGMINGDLDIGTLGKVVVCWVGTPVGAVIICAVVYHVLAFIVRLWSPGVFVYDPVMRWGLLLCGCYSAYALGANNVANVAAVYVANNMLPASTAAGLGGLCIAAGALTFSRGVMMTVGSGVVKLDAFSSLCCVLSLAITVHIYAVIGVPVSTSQGIIGAVLGIGLVKGLQTVNFRMLSGIWMGWILTPLVAAGIALAINAAW